MSATAATTPAPLSAVDRTPRGRGGFSSTFLRLEVRRLLRNRRTVFFTLVMPPLFLAIFGTNADYKTEHVGVGNVTAYVMISMAVYGAMLATTSGGAMVSVERAAGWSRQLRLTPLRPSAYIATKLATAMTLGLMSVVVVGIVGRLLGARIPLHVWLLCGVIAWTGSIVFAAFGLFMGYLLPSENVMQVLGPVLAVLAFAGGLFVPLDDGSWFATVSKFTPMNGLASLSRAPLGDTGYELTAVLNVVVWAAIFAGGAAWRFRRDTARV